MDLTKEEKQFLQLCDEGTAPISEFRALIDRGVRLNIYDEEGWHPLWHVSYAGRSDLADLFLQHGAEVDLANTDKVGETALMTASAHGHQETAKLLLNRGASVNFQQKTGTTALYFASSEGHIDSMKLLLNSGAQVNKGSSTPLYVASLDGRLNVVQVLLDHGADVNQPNDDQYRSSPLIAATCDDKFVPVTQLLINHGADINYQDAYGDTALHWAAQDGHPETAKILLQSQANLNIRNKPGDTPLHRAVENGHIEVVRLLLLSQANMEIKNNAGQTPLQVLEEKKHMEIVHLLKTGVPAQPAAKVSVSDKVEAISDAETGDGEEGENEEQPSMEEGLTGEQKADDHSQLSVIADYMKCPVCLNVEVDPCTLPCGHTFCQLCLARLWTVNKKICPVCKETWKIFPAISYDHRANIERTRGHEVEQIRKEYSQEDKELIEKYLEAKRTANLKSEGPAKELEEIEALPAAAAVWKLPGVEECDETSVIIYSSQGQLIEWNGLKLHIHAGSLPEGLQQCTIYIKTSISGEYQFLENTSLVSAVYWVRCEPQCTFTKPITVEIQHCSTKQNLSRLKIVRAFCSQELPYYFKPLGGGRFDANTAYGAIEVKGFSGFGVTEKSPASERLYYNQLFFCSNLSHQQMYNVEIHIVFTWNTEPHINYVSKKYPEEQGFHADCYQVVELVGSEIRVDLVRAKWTKIMDGQWEILPKKAVVTKSELDDFKPQRGIPNLMLLARPLCENFDHLLHEINLIGIKPPYNELTLYYMPSIRGDQLPASIHTDPATSDALQQPQELATRRINQQGRLRINDLGKVQDTIWEARTVWYNLGLALEITPDTLEAIKKDNVKTEDCFRDMLIKWLREHEQPTWSALAEALKSRSVGLSHLAQEIIEQN